MSVQHVAVCTSKTSPCVPAPRAHVLPCVRPSYTETFWTHTRGRVEWTTHGGFQRVTHRHHNTQHNTTRQDRAQHQQNTTPHGDRDRQRQRQTDTEREEFTKEFKTKQEKSEEKIQFQCGAAWPFFVDGVLFLVNPVCARDLSLPKQCQARFIFDLLFSASWQVHSFFQFLQII